MPGNKAKYADTYQWFDALNTACQYVLTQHDNIDAFDALSQYVLTQHADLTHANVHLLIFAPVVGLVPMEV